MRQSAAGEVSTHRRSTERTSPGEWKETSDRPRREASRNWWRHREAPTETGHARRSYAEEHGGAVPSFYLRVRNPT